MRTGIPFERYRWIANSFASPVRQPDFDMMICGLVAQGVKTTIWTGPRGVILVTWLNAVAAA